MRGFSFIGFHGLGIKFVRKPEYLVDILVGIMGKGDLRMVVSDTEFEVSTDTILDLRKLREIASSIATVLGSEEAVQKLLLATYLGNSIAGWVLRPSRIEELKRRVSSCTPFESDRKIVCIDDENGFKVVFFGSPIARVEGDGNVFEVKIDGDVAVNDFVEKMRMAVSNEFRDLETEVFVRKVVKTLDRISKGLAEVYRVAVLRGRKLLG